MRLCKCILLAAFLAIGRAHTTVEISVSTPVSPLRHHTGKDSGFGSDVELCYLNPLV